MARTVKKSTQKTEQVPTENTQQEVPQNTHQETQQNEVRKPLSARDSFLLHCEETINRVKVQRKMFSAIEMFFNILSNGGFVVENEKGASISFLEGRNLIEEVDGEPEIAIFDGDFKLFEQQSDFILKVDIKKDEKYKALKSAFKTLKKDYTDSGANDRVKKEFIMYWLKELQNESQQGE